jgi:hypothetical protein
MPEQLHPTKDSGEVRTSFKPLELTRRFFREPDVVSIYACQEWCRHSLEASCSCCARAGISLLLDRNLGSERARDLRSPICRAVVDHNDYCWRNRLRQNRLDCLSDRPLSVECRDYDAIGRHCSRNGQTPVDWLMRRILTPWS